MKPLFKILSLTTLVIVSNGCVNASKLARELGKDNATVVVDVGTVYGTAKIIRTNPTTNHSVTITPNGNVTIERK